MIDTGSVTTLGNIDIFKHFKNKQNLINPINLKTLAGTQLVLEEIITDVPDEFDEGGKTMSVKLVKFDGRPFDAIIGVNILFPFNMHIKPSLC